MAGPTPSTPAPERLVAAQEHGRAPRARVRAAGLDLTDVAKIRGLLDRWGESAIRRLCTSGEADIVRRLPPEHRPYGLAAAFGLKEAVIKAAGGIPRGGRFTDTDTAGVLHDLDRLADGGLCSTGLVVSGPTRRAVAAPGATIAAEVAAVRPELLLCSVLFREGTP